MDSEPIGDEPNETSEEDLKRKEAVLDALHSIMKYQSFFGTDHDAKFYDSCQMMYERTRKGEQQPQGKQKKLADNFQL